MGPLIDGWTVTSLARPGAMDEWKPPLSPSTPMLPKRLFSFDPYSKARRSFSLRLGHHPRPIISKAPRLTCDEDGHDLFAPASHDSGVGQRQICGLVLCQQTAPMVKPVARPLHLISGTRLLGSGSDAFEALRPDD